MVRNYEEAKRSHDARFRRFFESMLEGGVYLAPSRFEAGFASLAHKKRDIERTLQVARVAMKRVARVR